MITGLSSKKNILKLVKQILDLFYKIHMEYILAETPVHLTTEYSCTGMHSIINSHVISIHCIPVKTVHYSINNHTSLNCPLLDKQSCLHSINLYSMLPSLYSFNASLPSIFRCLSFLFHFGQTIICSLYASPFFFIFFTPASKSSLVSLYAQCCSVCRTTGDTPMLS